MKQVKIRTLLFYFHFFYSYFGHMNKDKENFYAKTKVLFFFYIKNKLIHLTSIYKSQLIGSTKKLYCIIVFHKLQNFH